MRAPSRLALALTLGWLCLPGCQDPASLPNVIADQDLSNSNVPTSMTENLRNVASVGLVLIPPSPSPQPSVSPTASPSASPQH